jgi:uncharacterized protein YcbK (DUF882 family)
MLRTLAIALLAVVATIAGSAEAFAETEKTGTQFTAAQGTPSPDVVVRRLAQIRARPAPQPAAKPAAAKWGVGRYAPPPVHNTVPPRPPAAADERGLRTLSFFNLHTRESITVTYKRDGVYVPSALARLNQFLRDDQTGTRVNIDPHLFDILWLVRKRLGSTSGYQVVSAYRAPSTNAWLVSYTSGVASDSRHMRGQAIDVMLPGRTPAQLRAAGLALGMGGVGYYPRTGFVHFDTGPVREW